MCGMIIGSIVIGAIVGAVTGSETWGTATAIGILALGFLGWLSDVNREAKVDAIIDDEYRQRKKRRKSQKNPARPPIPTTRAAKDRQQAAPVADEIQKLARLREQGLLSDEEFKAAKQRLLGP